MDKRGRGASAQTIRYLGKKFQSFSFMMLIQPFLHYLSPAGQYARLSILIFHRVLSMPDPLFPDEMHAQRFNEVCGWLKSWFNVLPLDKAVGHLKAGTLPCRAACITFDDGYSDNYHIAMPILQQHGLPCTFFIATGFMDGGCMWNDTIIEAVRRRLLRRYPISGITIAVLKKWASVRPGIHSSRIPIASITSAV